MNRKRQSLHFLLLFFGLFCIPTIGNSATNEVEPSHALSSVSVTDFGINDDKAHDLAVQEEGKIVVVGISNNSSDDDIAVARYLKDGTLDPSFNSDGRVTIAVGNNDDAAYSVDLQKDGKIVIAGSTRNAIDKDFAIIRLTEDGYLDKEFDGDGQVEISFEKGDDIAYQVLVREDGKIVVAGVVESGNNRKGAVVRLNSDGSLDDSFGLKGKYVIASESETGIYDMILLDDGKILLGGYKKIDDHLQAALLRVLENGNGLDSTFGDNGIALLDSLTTSSVGYGIALQNDKKTIIAGFSDNGQYRDILLARFNNNGSIDEAFGQKGVVISDLGYDSVAYSVAIQADNSIVSVGFGSNKDNKDVVFIYYNLDGDVQPRTSVGKETAAAVQEGI